MSYQVLARKWRPSTFAEMVGQVHVLKALVNALDQQRLHHAYLFTGTRGVGKTTIARLLAKSLNCEVGVSSTPCGVCSACTEIAEGRFVDLIEVDAASRTKVEDTRELLENVQYAPTRGRFKVYLIDEVHMLSSHSFNALLKTLEEPPPHVKFLLATTDPQKLPVTVLSRCLQFNLKNMSREHIVQHVSHVLNVEKVPFDDASLWAIAEGAQGSMRDALSLTDQAIAYGEGALREADVTSMLGTVDLRRVIKISKALFEKNIDELMTLVADIDEHGPDYFALMNELMSTLHRVAIGQAAPSAIDNGKGDQQAILALAKSSHAEDVHLFYQIGTTAKSEMHLAPSERAGFEMALLRMLAFSQTPAVSVSELPELTSAEAAREEANVLLPPKNTTLPPKNTASPAKPDEGASNAPLVERDAEPASPVDDVKAGLPPWVESVQPEPTPEPIPIAEPTPVPFVEPEPIAELIPEPKPEPTPVTESALLPAPTSEPLTEQEPAVLPVVSNEPVASEPVITESSDATYTEAEMGRAFDSTNLLEPAVWPSVDIQVNPVFWWQVTLHKLDLMGMTKTIFAHSHWQGYEGGVVSLVISPNYRKLMNDDHRDRLLGALPKWLPGCEKLVHEFGEVDNTPQLWQEKLVVKAKEQARQHLLIDPFVAKLVADYDAQLLDDSVLPKNNPIPSGA